MEISDEVRLLDALSAYIGELKQEERGAIQQELAKFVRWCGRDRLFGDITPAEVGAYAEIVATSSSQANSAKRLDAVKGFLSFAKKRNMIAVNLASHVRVSKSHTRASATSRGRVAEEVILTAEGLAQLKDKLKHLEEDRLRIAGDIRRAASDKDVRENAPLEAAREQQGRNESQIREIEETLKAAQVLSRSGKATSQARARVGSRVVIKDLGSSREMDYLLVSPAEASPLDRKLSVESPVGKALLQQVQGQEVEVDTPGGTQRYRILKVSR